MADIEKCPANGETRWLRCIRVKKYENATGVNVKFTITSFFRENELPKDQKVIYLFSYLHFNENILCCFEIHTVIGLQRKTSFLFYLRVRTRWNFFQWKRFLVIELKKSLFQGQKKIRERILFSSNREKLNKNLTKGFTHM